MAIPFILWFGIIASAWLLLRFAMAGHDNLEAICAIIVVWGTLFFGVLSLPLYIPQYISPPWNMHLAVAITLIIIVFSTVYFAWIKKTPRPPEVRMTAYFETIPPNEDQARFDYHIVAGDRNIRGLQVQVAHGYGEPLTWATLDLRSYSFEEARTRKSGKPIKQMPLGSHQDYVFTFLSIWAHSQRASFKTIDPPAEVPFENIYWKSPYPEVYIRFAGLRKEITEGWVVKFNKPPWKPALHDPVCLFPISSSEGKALIAEREKMRSSAGLEHKVTVYSKDVALGVSMGSAKSEDVSKKTEGTGSGSLGPTSDSAERAEPVERLYELATLRFDIQTTTDWIEIGLVDSRKVTVSNHDLTEGTMKSVEEPNSCHLRVDRPSSQAFFVVATFEVYSGPLLVFLRKSDRGTLKVDVRDKNGRFLDDCEYGATSQKYNYKEFGFDFSDFD
jgi:hypothetical protein